MATVQANITHVSDKGVPWGVVAAEDAVPYSKDEFTDPSASTQGDGVVPNGPQVYYWQVTASGGDVWVAFGSNPTASAGNDHLIVSGSTRSFRGYPGHKIAVIDVA